MENSEIRKAELSDIDKGLLEVFIEGYRFHQKGRPDVFMDLSDEELKNDLINSFERLETIVILAENKVLGYVSYTIKTRHVSKLVVDQLVIKEELRGLGLGRILMDEVKKIALENNCERIELNCWMFNTNAQAMYEHIGFDKQRIMYELKLKK